MYEHIKTFFFGAHKLTFVWKGKKTGNVCQNRQLIKNVSQTVLKQNVKNVNILNHWSDCKVYKQ